MKKIKLTKKTAKYFEYPGAIIIFGSLFLIPHLIKKFDFLNVISFKLWDCPGSFLCDVPIIKGLQDPAKFGLILVLYFIIAGAILLIWAQLFEVEKK